MTGSRIALRLALLVVVSLTAACERPTAPMAPPSGLVAVIDLDRVAEAVGRYEEIAARVQGYADQESAKLTRLRDDLRDQFQAQQDALGDAPSDDQKAQLGELNARMDTQLQQAISQAQQAAEQVKVQSVLAFKQEVQPVAERVVKARGYSVLLIQQPGMLYIDAGADITDAVIAELDRSDSPPVGDQQNQ